MEIYGEDAVKLTVTTINVFYIFGHPVNMDVNITYFCGNMMKVQRPLKLYVICRNLIYRSNQNGPPPSKIALLGQFTNLKIIYLISLGSKIGVTVGVYILFHLPSIHIPGEWSKTPCIVLVYIFCLATSIYHP